MHEHWPLNFSAWFDWSLEWLILMICFSFVCLHAESGSPGSGIVTPHAAHGQAQMSGHK